MIVISFTPPLDLAHLQVTQDFSFHFFKFLLFHFFHNFRFLFVLYSNVMNYLAESRYHNGFNQLWWNSVEYISASTSGSASPAWTLLCCNCVPLVKPIMRTWLYFAVM